jgi:DNA-binding PadR family transcriptional regulator
MQIEIAILGLLMEGNLYGYEIKKIIVDRLQNLIDIKFGSIYYAIKKAITKGWVQKAGSEKDAGNPERYIYEILPAGKKHYKKLLKNYFEDHLLHFEIDPILLFVKDIPSESAGEFVRERIEMISLKIEEISKRINLNSESGDKEAILPVLSYLEKHLNAELEWLAGFSGLHTAAREQDSHH